MNKNDRQQGRETDQQKQEGSSEQVTNPFEKNQSTERDNQQSKEDSEKEQQFKEALTERD